MILVFLLTTISNSWECHKTINMGDSSITFDLSRFGDHPESTFRQILPNSDSNTNGEYNWYFEVCGDTQQIPHEECCDQKWITENSDQPAIIQDYQRGFKNGNQEVFMRGPGPAWQVQLDSDGNCTRCFRLGRSQSFSAQDAIDSITTTITSANEVTNANGIMTWSLLSEAEPTLGVSITYHQGDHSATCGENNRQFRIDFECAPRISTSMASALDLSASVIEENPLCSYYTKVSSAAGCPTECPHNSRDSLDQICDGHGHCEMDPGMKKPRCFCDIGWTGIDCSVPTTAEIAMAEDRCYPLPNGHYVKGLCTDSLTTYEAAQYSDSSCTNPAGSSQRFITQTCSDIFGLTTGIECLVRNGPAIFKTSYCEVISDEATGSSSKSSNTALLVLLIILIVALLAAVGYLVYRQLQQPDLKNFLVLNDEQTTQL